MRSSQPISRGVLAVLRDRPQLILDYFKDIADLKGASISMGEHRVQLFGDIAVSTGYYTRSTSQGGPLLQSPARFTFVYQLRGGKWIIVAHHSSALPGGSIH